MYFFISDTFKIKLKINKPIVMLILIAVNNR